MASADFFAEEHEWDALHADHFLTEKVETQDPWDLMSAQHEKYVHYKDVDYCMHFGERAHGVAKHRGAVDPLGLWTEVSLKSLPKCAVFSGKIYHNAVKHAPRIEYLHALPKSLISAQAVTLLYERVGRPAPFPGREDDTDKPACDRVVQEILELRSGWDDEGGVAPSSEAKRSFVAVAAYLSAYMEHAEFEVDPSDGGVALRWFARDNSGLVSVDVRPAGNVVVAGTNIGGKSTQKSLSVDELDRVLRSTIDAGLTRLDDRMR